MLTNGVRQRIPRRDGATGSPVKVNRLTGHYLSEYHLMRKKLFPNRYISRLHYGDSFPKSGMGTSLFDALHGSIPTWPIVLIVVLLLFGVFSVFYFFKTQAWKLMSALMVWMEAHKWSGIVAYVAFATVGTIIALPESLFTIPAGFIFVKLFGKVAGYTIAVCSAFVGVYSGTVIAFLLSRLFIRPFVGSYISESKQFKVINDLLKRSGTRLVFLIRIAPMPGQLLLTYLLGLTNLAFMDMLLGSLGMFIGIVQYCLAGASLQSLESMDDLKENPVGLIIMVVSLAGVLYGVRYVSIMAKEEMQLTSVDAAT